MDVSLFRLKNKLADTLIRYSPNLYEQLRFYSNYHKFINREKPCTFSEKLLWLKHNTYSGNELILELMDKYYAREYVSDSGCGDTLTRLYFDTMDIREISYDVLPDSFALKRSRGCGANLVCNDKALLSESQLKQALEEWQNHQSLYDLGIERLGAGVAVPTLHYICEECLCDSDGNLPHDYKFYCFNGRPLAILYIDDRENKIRGGRARGCFMTTEWDFLSNLNEHYTKVDHIPNRPICLEKMLNVARILSSPFPFVRVDLYDIEGRTVFGELTFLPNGCIGACETEIKGMSMGSILRLPEQDAVL